MDSRVSEMLESITVVLIKDENPDNPPMCFATTMDVDEDNKEYIRDNAAGMIKEYIEGYGIKGRDGFDWVDIDSHVPRNIQRKHCLVPVASVQLENTSVHDTLYRAWERPQNRCTTSCAHNKGGACMLRSIEIKDGICRSHEPAAGEG